MIRILAWVLLLATAAQAGVVYTATTRSQTGEAIAVTRVRGYIQDANARLEFLEGSSQYSGTYILSRDGGKTFVQVDPERRVYARWDSPETSSPPKDEAQDVKTSISEPKFEKLLDEDGGLILGMKTRHVRFRTSYTFTVSLRESYTTSIISEDDLWITNDIHDPGLSYWLSGSSDQSGEQAAALVRGEISKINGIPLKRNTVLTSIEEDGESETTRTEMQVTEIARRALPASTFVIPAAYKVLAAPENQNAPDAHDH